jgi:hypothetical protein
MAEVYATDVAGDHGQPQCRDGREMADGVRLAQRTGHCTGLEEMPSDGVRVPVSSALDEGACTNPDQMASSDQGGHPVTAITALGQVTGERDTVESDQSNTQQFVHPLIVAW